MMWEQHSDGTLSDFRGRRAAAAAEESSSAENLIPSQEMTSLLLVVGDAFTAGDCGEESRGYLLLRLGLERALRLMADGHPWAGALCAHWRRFLAEYELRFPEIQPTIAASH